MTGRHLVDGHGLLESDRCRARVVAFGALLYALASLGWFATAQASATQTHPFRGSFGPEGPLSVTSFSDVEGVTVDQSSGDVYVYDAGTAGGSIYKFNATGEPLDFSALSADVITGVGGAQAGENEIAVDSSNGPAAGDIYIANGSVVGVYGPNGKPIEVGGKAAELNGEVVTEVPGAPWGEPCGVAVDPSGNVYVGLASGQVNKYTPTANPVVNSAYVSSLWGLSGEICDIAVDPEGSVYADTFAEGPVTEYAPSQFNTTGVEATGTPVDLRAGSTLAADPSSSSHVIYVDERGLIAEYETSGEPKRLGTFGASGSGTLNGHSYGVAGDPAGDVYAANGTAVSIFGPREPVPAQIDSEFASTVTSGSASLEAEINPEGADTTYYFQYGPEDCVEPPTSCVSLPAAPGIDIGAGEGDKAVSTHLQGLTSGSTYHYRVVAHNANGTINGPDLTFKTRGTGGPPALPDGRAWEMVSPLDKNNALLTGIDGYPTGTAGGLVQAAAEGGAIAYASNGAFASPVGTPPSTGPAGAPLSTQYLATRQADGWSTVSLIPPIVSESYFPIGQGGPYKAFSEDLSEGLLLNGENTPIQNPPLDGNLQLLGYQNFYVQQLATGAFQAVLRSPPSQSPTVFALKFEGATPDLTHMVFSTGAALTPEAVEGSTSNPNLYEWFGGQLRLINILPLETMGTPGAVLGQDQETSPGGLHPISKDGSRIFFTDRGNLYVREDGIRTVQVDEEKEGLASGEAEFQTASSDGSRVFFTDKPDLGDLYEFSLATDQLSDLTVAASATAEVQRVLGASDDGSYIYFVANGVLASGASPGDCSVFITGGGTGRCNLYVLHRSLSIDTINFIATVSEEDNTERPLYQFHSRGSADDWAPEISNRTSRVTPDGLSLVFMSSDPLTGYDNTPFEPSDCGHVVNRENESPLFVSGQCEEVYVYSAAGGGHLSCASCDPSAARPVGASSIPGGTQFELNGASYQSRVVSDVEGRARVFFDSSDSLVSQDTNGKPDVYEWEESGRGNCVSATGCVNLISSGTSDTESSFADANENGSDVFFLTTSELVRQDTDHLYDIYDARVNGGFPLTPTPPACTGTGCQGVPLAPPIFATPSSVTFSGVGNFTAPPRPKPEPLSRAQKLSRALSACHSKRKRQRALCESRAHRRYATKSKAKRTAKGRK